MNRSAGCIPLLCLGAVASALAQDAAVDGVDFDQQIAPILVAKCLECHSGESPKGGLSLVAERLVLKGGESGAVVIRGNAADSLLWQRVSDNEMPPKHPLDANEKASLRTWIEQGATWGEKPLDAWAMTTAARAGRDWWSLQPLRGVSPPVIPATNWPRNDVDAFVLRRLIDASLTPSPEADPRVLIRRLYFDLIGLPPTPEQIAAFAENPSDAAYSQVVDRLLASHHYGERWGRHWLDVVRFGESDGFERNQPRENAWPYRDWVISAINDDLPYDVFVRLQLVGDQLAGGVEGASATGFWVAGVHNTVVGGSDRMKQLARQDEIEEVLATVGQTFVGLTVNCARCHDHKFDPITQKEYYQLASTISGLGHGERDASFPEEEKKLATMNQRLSVLQAELAELDQRARREIIDARTAGQAETPDAPAALARWEFDGDLRDSVGGLHGKAVGNAQVASGADSRRSELRRDVSAPARHSRENAGGLGAGKQPGSTRRRRRSPWSRATGAGLMRSSLANEKPKRWMAGSNGFVRTESFHGEQEIDAMQRPVHVAIVYRRDGTIIGYRDGLAYGQPIHKAPLQEYQAGQTEVLFGLRHKPPGGNRYLFAKIHSAALYDRALTAAEVAASAGNAIEYVSEEEIVASLNESQRERRATLKSQVAAAVLARDQQAARTRRKIYTLAPGAGATIKVLLRGDPDNLGAIVSPASTAAIEGLSADFDLSPDAPEAERRRKLAEWVTHEGNPLFARVMANRVWHYHFGVGIVETPNDFGFNGGRPSHPDLLEFLAWNFRENGYQLKWLHRLIVHSATYRQAASGISPARWTQATAQDAGNRLLWRGSPRRLEAESLRDAMLSVAGKLNDALGGPSFKDVSVDFNSGTTYYEPLDVDGPEFWRRHRVSL